MAKKAGLRRIFVLDTNVLMHDPSALFRFEEHDVYILMTVLEELDRNKKGPSEQARNARQAHRFLHDLLAGKTKKEIESGIKLSATLADDVHGRQLNGHLFFQTKKMTSELPVELPGNSADNSILTQTHALQQEYGAGRVTLVSKDINMLIKAALCGIRAEDFSNDRTLTDARVLYRGQTEIKAKEWEAILSRGGTCEMNRGVAVYRFPIQATARTLRINEFVVVEGAQTFEGVVQNVDKGVVTLVGIHHYSSEKRNDVWGIGPRNREQNFALNALMNPDIHLVTILGVAGTGKTLITLASALDQILNKKMYEEIIMTRVTIPLGEDIGFLPGNEEEKMEPWMGALMDNLEFLTRNQGGGEWGRGATNDLLRNRIKIRSMNFMRGRTFLNRFLILDEAQNLTPKQMKALLTRAGPGTKIVCLGNIAQIDSPYLSETTSGLTYVVNRFRGWKHYGHIILEQGERSPLADYANTVMD